MDYFTLAFLLRRHSALVFILCILLNQEIVAQKASLSEIQTFIPTYMFSDPDPIPILAKRTDIYPYFRFDGYSELKENKEWTVVELENPYIQVGILPEVGGKVWGIREKGSGMDYIYWNEVLKFRDVAMRGAWTSGGIEFNFGFIGHTPATATPVDYLTRENADGSVSCFIGGLDLAARTEWRVEMRLPADKAYLETRSYWMNPNPLHHAYYYWSNSAVHATQDLEFYYPGDHYIGHDGKLSAWPIDREGRDLSKYANNAFGPHKSYHILGHNENHQGVYWKDKAVGMGHWALQRDLPGQKLWLWALSRNGGIWEDLLTDQNGQYVEVQAGRMFNQANLNSGHHSPFGQGVFYPFEENSWRELWFPLIATEGLSASTEKVVLHLEESPSGYLLHLMGLEEQENQLTVYNSMGDTLLSQPLSLSPLDQEEIAITYKGESPIQVQYGDLHYTTQKNPLSRPLSSPPINPSSPSARRYDADQEFLFRNYAKSKDLYAQILAEDPVNPHAWTRLAELAYRRGEYGLGISYLHRVLAVNTYDGAANFLLGSLLRAQGEDYAAREAFALATKDPRYTVGASIQQAQLLLKARQYAQAAELMDQLMDQRGKSVGAMQVKAIAERLQGNGQTAQEATAELLQVDPLNHLARFEKWAQDPSDKSEVEFQSMIRNELPHETYLELAMYYHHLGLSDAVEKILERAPEHPMVAYWQYALSGATLDLEKANQLSVEGVFPFRLESIPVLSQAIRHSSSWKPNYYLGLLYWGIGKKEAAYTRMKTCGEQPNVAPFYLTRALLGQELGATSRDIQEDFEKAAQLDPQQWRTYKHAGAYYEEEGAHEQALTWMQKGHELFPENYNLGLSYASQLLRTGAFKACLELLADLQVLPFEGASAGHSLYEQAHILQALSWMEKKKYKKALNHLAEARKWPEHLGVGKPYDPDERLTDYLTAICTEKQGKEANAIWERLATGNYPNDSWQFCSIAALQKLDRSEELQARYAALPGEHVGWIKAYTYRSSDLEILMEALEEDGEQVPLSKDALLVRVLRALER